MAVAEEVKLFRSWSSPFGLRVVWALKLKGIGYDEELEDLSNKSPLLLQYNPVYKKIPVLVHNGKPICESLLIIEYLEETWKQTPLLPEDPHQRALARFWAKFGDEKVFETMRFGILLKQGKEQEEAIVSTLENLKYLEEELKGKKFFGGETIGLVDIALGWLAYHFNVVEEIIGVKLIEQQKFPLLVAWMQEFSNIPTIQESWPPRDKLFDRLAGFRKAALGEEHTPK
ncbi:probable glutathione S-transferase [Hevea brasiliensis]|uniref:probable glutathione S-transferase n=1 Tax=Hevea brasiliensis TaxID=3981 RepID=UPI0025DD7F8A|nr:probable glutathione S-transferase [Hevea brasiliensis]